LAAFDGSAVLKLVLILIVLLAAGGAVAAVIAISRRREAEAQRRRQRRFELPETGDRVPLVEPDDQEAAAGGRTREDRLELAAYLGRVGVDDNDMTVADAESPQARFVTTPDGDMLLTQPPFQLRPSLFTDRAARYATAIARRLPPWVVICPRVRLDTLLSPTAPDGRDADDWRTWRRRVRLRSVDLLLVDRRTWAPLVAIVFQREADARRLGRGGHGARDMMVDEVLRHVGLPVVVATGRMAEDWPMVRPWIEQALIEGPDERKQNGAHTPARRPGWDASAAVALLGLDEDDEVPAELGAPDAGGGSA
jgi:hypothetical protein